MVAASSWAALASSAVKNVAPLAGSRYRVRRGTTRRWAPVAAEPVAEAEAEADADAAAILPVVPPERLLVPPPEAPAARAVVDPPPPTPLP